MQRSKAIALILLVVISSAVFVQANSSGEFLDNGFVALFYHAMRLEDTFPSINPLGMAIEEFDKAIRDNDNPGEANLMIGLIYQSFERPGTALGYYLEFASLHPEEVWVQALIGDLYAEMGRFAEAEASYQAVLASQAEEEYFARAYFGLGNIYFERADYDQAKEAFELALTNAGDFVDARLGLGKALYHLEQYEAAIESLELAQLQASRSSEIVQYLALSYEASGLTEQAEHAYSRFEELKQK